MTTQCDSAITIHYFVDEAGDPVLFDGKGRILVGTEGCSTHFILGKLDVDDPVVLTATLEQLRADLLADPYFKGIPSMQPAAKKTALKFHAKDDLPEVRREVFRLLLTQKCRFYAVVRDKRELVAYVRQQNERDLGYHYRENELYDTLVSRLFRTRLCKADQFNICFSKRGKSDRTAALKEAIAVAVGEYERDYGIKNQAAITITSIAPPGCGGLQAVDYFMWALQRFYVHEHTDKRDSECRYVEMIHELTGEIEDLDFVWQGKRGIIWNKTRPLTLAARMSESSAKKKPGI